MMKRVLSEGRSWASRKVATLALTCMAVAAVFVVIAVAVVVPPPVSADRFGSQCFTSDGTNLNPDSQLNQKALLLRPIGDDASVLGDEWQEVVAGAGIHANPGHLVDSSFFHLMDIAGGALDPSVVGTSLKDVNRDSHFAAEVKAEWGTESDAQAVLDGLKVQRYGAGLGALAESKKLTKPMEGQAWNEDKEFTGSVSSQRPVTSGSMSGSWSDDGGSVSGTITSDVTRTYTDDYSNIGLQYKDRPAAPPGATREPGPHSVTEVDHTDNPHVEFANEVGGEQGNSRVDALVAEQAVDTVDALVAEQAVDTVGDVVRVTVMLRDRHRNDVEFNNRIWPLFGQNRVGEVSGLWPKQSFLWDWRAADPSLFGRVANSGELGHGGVVEYAGGTDEAFRVEQNAVGLLTGGEVRWPVYLSDMAWYLYKVEGVSAEHFRAGKVDDLVDAMVGDVGDSRAVFSYIANERDVVRVGLPNQVKFSTMPDMDKANPYKGVNVQIQGHVFMPFEGLGSGWGKVDDRGATLVKAGVASPEDEDGDPTNRGMNTFFQFDILEHHAHGKYPSGGLKGLGIGSRGHHWWNLEERTGGWPNGELDPNATHILVVTFYEGRAEKRRFEGRDGGAADMQIAQYQKVICRVVVPPLGAGFGSDKESGFWRKALGWLSKIPPAIMNLPGEIWGLLGQQVVNSLTSTVSAAENAGCSMVDHLDYGGGDLAQDVSFTREGSEVVTGREDCEEATRERTVAGNIEGVPGSGVVYYAPRVAVHPPRKRAGKPWLVRVKAPE